MTIPVKLGIAVLRGGSVAVGGYGIYELSKPKTIGQQLMWEGKILGDVVGSSDYGTGGLWERLYEKYNADSSNKFKENGNDATRIDDKNKLKSYCKKVFDFSKNDQDNLNKAKFWCTKESEKLGKR